MRNNYRKQLEELNYELMQMGSEIEYAIEKAVTALENRDVESAKEAIEMDDRIDRREKEIESLCMKLLLLQQPIATDLRNISAALKIITDMERIGDQAADISEITLLLAREEVTVNLESIRQMAAETINMVNKSVESYVERDIELAGEVICNDDIVDELFLKTKNELIDMIKNGTPGNEQATDLLMAAKYFERIGDHAVNIAERVVYFLNGGDEDDGHFYC